MNVQDAKNLTIPEGSVKMIHDKDNRLLWGAVGYNTKYAGDTTQKTTTGKNLYNATKAETTTNSLVWSADTSEISLNGHITSSANLNLPNVSLKAGTYVCSLEVVSGTISSTSTGLNTYFSGTNVSRTPSSFNLTNASPRNTFVITVSADTTDAHLFFYARTSETFSNVKVKYQIIAGSTADYSFEPYTNGPAPNPDYPETVNVVTGEQMVTISDGGGQSATYKVDLTGKNIIDGSYDGITSFTRCTGERSGNGFKITSTGQSGAVYATIPVPNYSEFLEKTVTLSYDGIGSNVNVSCYYLASDGRTPSSSYLNNISSGTSFTFPSSIPAGSTGVCLVFYSSVNNNTTYNNIQLELGSSPTSYEPHYDYELCKIGNYQDYIYKSGDDWYVHKEFEKLELSSMTFGMEQASGSNYRIVCQTQYTNLLKPDSNTALPVAICSHYVRETAGRTYTSNQGISMSQSYRFYIYDNNYHESTSATGYNAWIITARPYVHWALAIPTDTKITDATLISQLNAVHEWLTRYGYNATVAGNLPIIIDKTNL